MHLRRAWENLKVIDMFLILIGGMVLWVLLKLIKLYTLNTCSLLYVNYTSIKLLKNIYGKNKRVI